MGKTAHFLIGKRKIIRTGLIVGFAGTLTPLAYAVDVDGQAVFAGSILDSCVVNVLSAGTLGVSTDKTIMSSEESGGSAASATITTNSANSTVQIINPLGFTLGPSDADTNSTYTTSYVLTGATTATESDGTTATSLGVGATNMTLNAAATKSSGNFSAGTYSLTTTIRCVTP